MPRRNKEHIVMRVDPDVKAIARQRARTQRRTITGYVQWLIVQDSEQHEREQQMRRHDQRVLVDAAA